MTVAEWVALIAFPASLAALMFATTLRWNQRTGLRALEVAVIIGTSAVGVWLLGHHLGNHGDTFHKAIPAVLAVSLPSAAGVGAAIAGFRVARADRRDAAGGDSP